jgi:hypothetical protein
MRLDANSFYSAKRPRLLGVNADAQKKNTQYVIK